MKSVIREAVLGEPLILTDREPEVRLVDFAASAMTYRVRVWTSNFGADERVRDRVRSRIYYAFRRHRITIPYPMQVQIEHEPAGAAPSADDAAAHALAGVEILASLTDGQRAQLAGTSQQWA